MAQEESVEAKAGQSPQQSLLVMFITVLVGVGLAWAGSQGSWHFGPLPGFAVVVAAAFLIQWVVYVHAAIRQTERFFDATGSATYIVVTLAALIAAPERSARDWVLAALVIIWAVRLGSFLFIRIRKAGEDDRFEHIRRSPVRFLSVWTLQGLWVSMTAAAAWIAITSQTNAPFGVLAWVGIAVWLFGFVFEVVADTQKTKFKADPANNGTFIRTGLWSVSRHPNYFGEISLWVGIFLIAMPSLQGWQWIAVLSPIFVTFLLTKVSGIPLLEKKADKKWGDDPDYQAYKQHTSVLIPRPQKHE